MHIPGAWRTGELSFESERDHANPYLEVDATVEFSGPDGQVVRRPAFWDGGRTWRVRFAPTVPGTWRYRVVGPDAARAGISGGGELTCGDDTAAHPFAAHGFLRASSDGHHFEHRDGTPFFWLGDTHWRFAWERWAAANKPGWTSQFRGMVDLRVEQGFSVYQTNLLSFEGGWNRSPMFRSQGDRTLLDIDWVQAELDPRMAYVAERGLLNAVGIGWYDAIDEDVTGMVRLARYLVARYGSTPVVWTIAGEVAGYDPLLRPQRIEGWGLVAAAIHDADGYGHPIGAHLTAERPIPGYYQDEPWLGFTLNQHGHGDVDAAARHYAEFLATHPARPLVEGESMYEGLTSVEYLGRRTVTDSMVRHVAYRAMQAGCAGYTYGAQGVWNGAWAPGDGASMWGDLAWYDGVELLGAPQLGQMRRFYEAAGWADLRPDPACFTTTNVFNSALYPPAMTADAGRMTVVGFFPETYRRGAGLATLQGLAGESYTVRWFDPRDGSYLVVAEDASPAGGVLPLPDKPDDRDWLLVAEARR